MGQIQKMKDDLFNELKGYMMEFVYIEDLNNVYEDVQNLESQLQSAQSFILITKCALIDTLMLTVSRLYDKSDEAKTIPNLINKFKKNAHLFEDEVQITKKLNEFEKELDQDEYIRSGISVIMQRRDKIYAHNDKKYFGLKNINDETYLPMYKVWMILRFTKKLLEYLFSLFLSNQIIETKYKNDLKNLIK